MLGGDRLSEGTVERCRVDEFGSPADAALAQVPVGEEGKLERSNGTLDRHVNEIDDEASPLEALERVVQAGCSLGGVEGERALVPARPRQTLRLLRLEAHTARDNEHVVRERRAVIEHDLVALGRDRLDLVFVEDHAGTQLSSPRTDDFIQVREAERDEEQPRLVDVAVVAVDDVDLSLLGIEPTT
jgi:hypothetical protein